MSITLLRPSPSLLVLSAAFHTLARGVVELRAQDLGIADDLIDAYAGFVEVYAHALLDRVAAMPETSEAWPEILEHLLRRLRQARTESVLLEPIDVMEQLAARIQHLEEIVL
ncbi:MAG: hypothetical protein JOZ87_07455 [Chloroflexi bacterium]|nr:hypothetical protein [Chloroflexota bacterium]